MGQLLTFTSLLLLWSCDQFIQSIEGDDYKAKSVFAIKGGKPKDHVSIVFSGNINGETHPCGCRHFPLGGLAQVNGLFAKLKKEKPFIYIDAGDTLFDAPTISSFSQESKVYRAKSLVKALGDLGLAAFTPGDQDFAAGEKVFLDLIKSAKFKMLAVNFKNNKVKLPNWKPWMAFKFGSKNLVLIGVVNPKHVNRNTNLFTYPLKPLANALKSLKDQGIDPKDKNTELILVSSGGTQFNEEIIEAYPDFDWVLGSHNQNFNKTPKVKGSTKLVQVLSRNHYMGEAKIYLSNDVSKEQKENQYQVHEVRDELVEMVKDNPFVSFVEKMKVEIKKIQLKEEAAMASSVTSNAPISTANSCLGCHDQQGEKWKSTSHSVAFATLIRVNEDKNPKCIECHSLNYKKSFSKTEEMTLFKENIEPKKTSDYWNAFKSQFSPLPTIRELSSEATKKFATEWLQLDDKFEVSHQYGNVQCLNCHGQKPDHPFEVNKPEISMVARKEEIKTQCLNCHTPDQSPSWYEKSGEKRLNQEEFNKHYTHIACPSIEK